MALPACFVEPPPRALLLSSLPSALFAVALALLLALVAPAWGTPARAASAGPTPTPAPPPLPSTQPATAAHFSGEGSPPLAFLLLDGSAPLDATLAAVEAAGGATLHAVPPHALVAALPPPAAAALRGQAGIVEVVRGRVDAAALRARYGAGAGAAAFAWNRRVDSGFVPAPDAAALEAAGAPPGAPLAGDALELPANSPRGWADGLSAAATGPGAPGYWETSSYLIGRVVVAVVLPESRGAGENWADLDPAQPGAARADLVLEQVIAGMESWAAAEPRAGLEFVYAFHSGVPTDHEPVSLSSSEQSLWITQVMDARGYGWVADPYEKTRQFANDLRRTYAADWAFTFFVLDSLHDADGMLADGRFGYAYLGGPFAVMTYDNDGWGIGQMHSVAAHEAAHIFHALDEYEGAHIVCTARAGYLDAEHQNSQYHPGGACGSDVPCVMRGGGDGRTACVHTRAQLGWRDEDGDNILDPVDTAVNLSLDPWPPELSNDATPTYAGRIVDTPRPSARFVPVTVNSIARIEAQVDGGPWQAVPVADGALDGETVEEYALTLGPLADGGHTLWLRAANSAGNYSNYLWDTFTLDTTPPAAAVATQGRYGGADFPDFGVDWSLSDALTGVAEGIIEVRDGNGPWQEWRRTAAPGGDVFIGQDGHSYSFRVQASDLAGNTALSAPATRTVSVCPAPPDAEEAAPGDNRREDARWVDAHGSARERTFDRPGDADWVMFETVAGVRYTVLTENAGGYADTVVQVITPGGTLENDDDPAGGLGSRVSWLADVPGVAYARIRHADPYAFGCQATYRLRVFTDDATSPAAALTLAGGADWVTAHEVPVHLDVWDDAMLGSSSGVWKMRAAAGALDSTAWQIYAADFAVPLPAREGTHLVLAQVMDHAGRISNVVSDTVGVDVTLPTAALGALPPQSVPGALAVSWTALDTLSGVEVFDVELRDGPQGVWTPWLSRTAEAGASFTAVQDHTHWVRVRAHDRAGNAGPWAVSSPIQVAGSAAAPSVYLPLVGRGR